MTSLASNDINGSCRQKFQGLVFELHYSWLVNFADLYDLVGAMTLRWFTDRCSCIWRVENGIVFYTLVSGVVSRYRWWPRDLYYQIKSPDLTKRSRGRSWENRELVMAVMYCCTMYLIQMVKCIWQQLGTRQCHSFTVSYFAHWLSFTAQLRGCGGVQKASRILTGSRWTGQGS